MPTLQTFPTGQSLTSSALSTQEIQTLFQAATCWCFGITKALAFTAILEENSNQATLNSVVGISVGFKISDASGYGLGSYGDGGYGEGGNIPLNTVIQSILGNVITMSNAALANITETIYVTDPTAGTQVRQAWPENGAPAWGQTDNVTFVRCVEIDGDYNKVRDQGATPNEDDLTATVTIEYTRIWRVFWELRGPTSYSRGTLLKSAMQFDFIHDMLAASNIYLVPNLSIPRRVPELVEGKWWERADLIMEFYEQVNETTTVNTVGSIEVAVNNSNGVASNVVIN